MFEVRRFVSCSRFEVLDSDLELRTFIHRGGAEDAEKKFRIKTLRALCVSAVKTNSVRVVRGLRDEG